MSRLFRSARGVFVSLLTLSLSACEVSEQEFSGGIIDGQPSPAQPAAPGNQKISLLSATSAELVDYVVDCHGQGEKQICLLICHRPPGNPENSESKILPLKASLAHLDHEDYLGSCDNEAEELPEEPSEEIPAEDEGGGPLDGDLPAWCEENITFDSNCDGIDDETGQPIY